MRYLLRRAWPAIASEPALENERLGQQGALFHRLVQQHLLGLPAERLAQMAPEPPLRDWWQAYRNQAGPRLGRPPAAGTGEVYPEFVLTTRLGSQRLLAKYDLLLVAPTGQITIVDWKTARQRPGRAMLARRWQTRVYPYVLAQAGALLNHGQPVPPAAIQMIYWFANAPDQPEVFAYSAEQEQQDEHDLLVMFAQADSLPADGDLRTARVERCRFCVYRSLCERGIEAGEEAERDDEAREDEAPEVELDFDQIVELKL